MDDSEKQNPHERARRSFVVSDFSVREIPFAVLAFSIISAACVVLGLAVETLPSFWGLVSNQSVAKSKADSNDAESEVLPKYDGVILHTFPDGKRVRIDTPPASSGIFEGLSGEHIFTRSRGGTGRTELMFEFTLMAHRQGKDVYQITRTVTDYDESQTKGSAGRGRISKFSIEFDGTPITIGDDMHGVTRLMSRELATEGRSLEESAPVDDPSVDDSENLGNEP